MTLVWTQHNETWWRATEDFKVFNVRLKYGRPERGGKAIFWEADVAADVPSEKALAMGIPEAKATELVNIGYETFDDADAAKAWCETQR